jgi:hypothetical protein
MVFSVSRQTAEVTLLVSFAVFTVCCAGIFEQKNETGMGDEPSGGLETASSMYDSAMRCDSMRPVLYAISLL